MTGTLIQSAPAQRSYQGTVTQPDRWSLWAPRHGDVLIVTPPKCGTTWTQSIVTMLLNGSPDLPEKVSVLSPWIDATFAPAEDIAAALDAQTGRRVAKTHTPADGYPVYDGQAVIAVFRHPLDMFFSLRKHLANIKTVGDDHPLLQSVPEALDFFLTEPENLDDWDRDSLAHLVRLFHETCLADRVPDLLVLHYSDMRADHRGAVARIAAHIRCDAAPELIDAVTAATAFDAMKKNHAIFTPEVNSDLWRDSSKFFDAGTSQKWLNRLDEAQVARFEDRLATLIPDPAARQWLKTGGPWPPRG